MATLNLVPDTGTTRAETERVAEKVKECRRRIERARQDRFLHQSRHTDCYKFAMPWRHKLYQTIPTDQLDEIFDSTAMTVVEDFAADMLNTFTPIKNNWMTIEPAQKLGAGEQNQIRDQLGEYRDVLFAEMARSNLYQALQESYADLGVGTMGMIIKDFDPAEPLHCQAIPVTELLLDRGPYGTVGGFWREWKLRAEDIPVMWPDAKQLDGQAEWKPGDSTLHDVIDGLWRDWTDKGNEVYRYVVLCDDKMIYEEDYKGAGSNPFIAARWSRDSTTAWGVGPTYRSLPDIKTINHVKFIELKNHDKHSDPVVSYEDDNVINLDQGTNPGMWIPRAVGSKAPETVESKTKLDRTIFQIDQLQSSIRRAHYQDRPEQKGKTPPTAQQWADEAAERARRMGSPATNLVQELQIPIVRRFAFLLNKRGVLPKVTLNGKDIALIPVSPLLRAQEQETVIRNDRFVELMVSRFGPQVGMIVVNIVKYAQQQAKLLGVDQDLVRNETDLADAIKKFLPVLQSTNRIPSPSDIGIPPGIAQGQGGPGPTAPGGP